MVTKKLIFAGGAAALAAAFAVFAQVPDRLMETFEKQKSQAAAAAPQTNTKQNRIQTDGKPDQSKSQAAAAKPAGEAGSAGQASRHETENTAAPKRQQGTASAADVNPVTGKPLSLEDKIREFEEAQLDAKIAAERLAAKKAEIEMKKLENEMRSGTPSSDRIEEAIRKLESLSAQQKKTAKPAAPEPPPAPPAPALPRLVGIMTANGERVALIETGGKIITARSGDTVLGARVGEIDDKGAVINGMRVTTDSRPARIAWSSQGERPRVEQAGPPAVLSTPAPPQAVPPERGAPPFGNLGLPFAPMPNPAR
ncbi:hypothetical protein [Pelomicrobium methylotrophicum]|uniref:Type IV pilus biogenesis protein PilP n=1 Tax=Pelomicrobium methylotrophicum TaxID=2602750 RepID=A0A5C7EU82_9PROT|nr:hypothetical protein [Pelomicrobium methylotrophicum]TXF11579.1 hypothetical protein FR698_09575 [Pelomicrobium methylotrophicum]